MTRLLAALVCLGALPLALAAPVPKDARKPVLYYPTTEATWIYRYYGVNDPVGRDYFEVVMSVWEKDGTHYVRMGCMFDGKKKTSTGGVVAVSGKGLVEGIEVGVRNFAPSDEVLRVPSLPGEKWTGELSMRPADRERRYVSRGPEEVDVPAGKFQAMRVDREVVCANGKLCYHPSWYVVGIGLVKWEDDEGRSKVLKSFTAGK
ncbi:hypothetical protein [Frigoriglobus tundricola]|uniref:Uncharacterized protein n=1 Tax=Frigoriglobus tundricola TaxID=2774151 RepID=A0A6M5Z257_9BACT|nr:hypothetical protein [Frigoriglobus tundricola]QJW99252.1 hypothetical protein FTUN_6854 [Frigoriglobus tundricola]